MEIDIALATVVRCNREMQIENEKLKEQNQAMKAWLETIHKLQGWTDLGDFLKSMEEA